jgi:hypothetical protein
MNVHIFLSWVTDYILHRIKQREKRLCKEGIITKITIMVQPPAIILPIFEEIVAQFEMI